MDDIKQERREPPQGRTMRDKRIDRMLLLGVGAFVLALCGITYNNSLELVRLQTIVVAQNETIKSASNDKFTGRQGKDLSRRVRQLETHLREHEKGHGQ